MPRRRPQEQKIKKRIAETLAQLVADEYPRRKCIDDVPNLKGFVDAGSSPEDSEMRTQILLGMTDSQLDLAKTILSVSSFGMNNNNIRSFAHHHPSVLNPSDEHGSLVTMAVEQIERTNDLLQRRHIKNFINENPDVILPGRKFGSLVTMTDEEDKRLDRIFENEHTRQAASDNPKIILPSYRWGVMRAMDDAEFTQWYDNCSQAVQRPSSDTSSSSFTDAEHRRRLPREDEGCVVS